MTRVLVRTTMWPSLWEALEARAKEQGDTPAAVVRAALCAFLDVPPLSVPVRPGTIPKDHRISSCPCPDCREVRQARRRERSRARWAKTVATETPEEREARRKKRQRKRAARVATETPEEREVRLGQGRKSQKAYRESHPERVKGRKSEHKDSKLRRGLEEFDRYMRSLGPPKPT